MKLCPKRLEDAANDYAWRKDAELARLDAALPVSISFSEYLMWYADELRYPGRGRCRFAIETLEGKHIGNCVYFGIDGDREEVELGIMIGDRAYWDHGYGADAVATLLSHIFDVTKLDRVYLKTLEWNMRAQRCFQKCGFVPCGQLIREGHSFILMELRRHQLESVSPSGRENNEARNLSPIDGHCLIP